MLFLKMRPGKKFTASLVKDIKAAIATSLSPRHVPKYIFETPEIPVRSSSMPSPAFLPRGASRSPTFFP